jgi:hypothetical protein
MNKVSKTLNSTSNSRTNLAFKGRKGHHYNINKSFLLSTAVCWRISE